MLERDRCCPESQYPEAMNHSDARKPMRLGEFILENMEPLLETWEEFARKYWKGPVPDVARLRNDAEVMLRAVVADMASGGKSFKGPCRRYPSSTE